MEKKVQEYIKRYQMIPEHSHLILGVSGGADSTALLLLLHQLQQKSGSFTMEVLHVEHGIRGKESLEDACFTEELCRRLEVECRVVSVDVPRFAQEMALGTEEAARILRRRALIERARLTGGRIVLAHHENDQAETMLFHMARGSALRGMSGMAPVVTAESGIVFIRPLLCASREELEEYLAGQGQDYRTDSTNCDDRYARNRIRHQILPELTRVNTQAVRHLSQAAEELLEVRRFLEQQADSCEADILSMDSGEGSVAVSVSGIRQLSPVIGRILLERALEKAAGARRDLEKVHVEELLSLTEGQSGRQIDLPYGITAVREYDRLILKAKKQTARREEQTLPADEADLEKGIVLTLGGYRLFLKKCVFSCNFGEIPKNSPTKWFDYDKIKNGLLLRYRRPGDTIMIHPSGQTKSLNRYFIDAHVPAGERDKVPLLADGSSVLWVLGGRSSEGCRVTDRTRYILIAEITEGEENG